MDVGAAGAAAMHLLAHIFKVAAVLSICGMAWQNCKKMFEFHDYKNLVSRILADLSHSDCSIMSEKCVWRSSN